MRQYAGAECCRCHRCILHSSISPRFHRFWTTHTHQRPQLCIQRLNSFFLDSCSRPSPPPPCVVQRMWASLRLLEAATAEALGRQRLADHARVGGLGGSGLLEWGTAERDARSVPLQKGHSCVPPVPIFSIWDTENPSAWTPFPWTRAHARTRLTKSLSWSGSHVSTAAASWPSFHRPSATGFAGL